MNIQGQVEKITSKSGVSKAGRNYTKYSMLVNGTWYGSFNPIAAQEGAMVSFEASQNGNFWNVEGAVQTVGGAPAPAPQAQPQAAAPAQPQAMPVNTRDISILYQSSRKDAIALLPVLVEQGAIPGLTKTTKASDKYDIYLALVDELSARFYMKAKEVVDNGGPSDDDVIPDPGE